MAWNYPLPLLIKWFLFGMEIEVGLELSSSPLDKMERDKYEAIEALGIILFPS